MALALEVLRPQFKFDYSKVDVDSDKQLTERYGSRVPVLLDGEFEVGAGYLEPGTLESYFLNRAD
tara:strand:- start:3802 stop:3996 length:195 start_codon:yes stop_codon:yes gene_type:complete